VLYIGAASGQHIPYLVDKFPNFRYYLYDPVNEDTEWAENLLEKAESWHNIRIYSQFFDESKYEFIRNELSNSFFVLISDIRTTANTENVDFDTKIKLLDERVSEDQAKQMKWCQDLKPDIAFLKFKLPLGNPTYEYLPGTIFCQPYLKTLSRETRLLVTKQNLENALFSYSEDIYSRRIQHHNVVQKFRKFVLPDFSRISKDLRKSFVKLGGKSYPSYDFAFEFHVVELMLKYEKSEENPYEIMQDLSLNLDSSFQFRISVENYNFMKSEKFDPENILHNGTKSKIRSKHVGIFEDYPSIRDNYEVFNELISKNH